MRDHRERRPAQKVQLEVYQHVVTSLEKGTPEMQRVAPALVASILDEPLRGGLLQALGEAAVPVVARDVRKTIDQENRFRTDEATVAVVPKATDGAAPARSFNWEDFDYDVFWCERSGEPAHRTASAIVEQLKKEGAKGRLRVRMLPDSINARAGYQHAGFVIRMNVGEEKQAQQLERVGDAVVGQSGAFRVSISSQPTPWYLSAFVCPAA